MKNRNVRSYSELDEQYRNLLLEYISKHQECSQASIAKAINPKWTRSTLYRSLHRERRFNAEDIMCINNFLGLNQTVTSEISSEINVEDLKKEVKEYLSQTSFSEYTGMGINEFRNALENGALNTSFLEYQKVIPLKEVPYVLSSRDNMMEQRNFLLGLVKKMNYELELAYMIKDSRYLQEHLFNLTNPDGSLIPESLVDKQFSEMKNNPTVTETEKEALQELESELKRDDFYAIYHKYANIMDTMLSIIKQLAKENEELNRKINGNA